MPKHKSAMKFLTILVAAGHFTATSAFYPYQLPGSTSPIRRNVQQISDHPSSVRIPLRKVKRSNIFKIIQSDNPSSPNSAAVDQDGSDYSYMCELQFGANKKSMFLLLDTAAVNTWVMSSNCTTTSCSLHNTYGSPDSSSLQVSSNPFSISYGTGSVSGTVATDSANFIGQSLPLTFGLATTVSGEFESYPMDGILGLGRLDNVDINPNGVKGPTLVDVLFSEKVISSKVFGLRLSRTSDGHKNGEINFGAPDSSAFTGDLHYVPALKNNRGFWEVAIDSIKFNGKTAAIQQDATALLDSGTSFMLLPPADAQAIHSQIPNSNFDGESFTVPCDTKIPLVISFGGKEYTISPQDYIAPAQAGKCYSNIIARQTFEKNQWLVGDVFLKGVYSVWDADKSRVGLAQSASAPSPSSGKPTSQQQSDTSSPSDPSPSQTTELTPTNAPQVSNTAAGPSATVSKPPLLTGTSGSNSTSGATTSSNPSASTSDAIVSYSRFGWLFTFTISGLLSLYNLS